MKHLLIAGRAGAGKTTLIKELAQRLRGCPVDGFYTEELREDGQRLGFWLSSLDGRQALLAHRHSDSPHRVGVYRVNVPVLDDMAVTIMRRAIRESLILFIDEIGKMELLSHPFQQTLEEALDRGPRIVGTVGVQHFPFLDTLKRRRDVELVPLSLNTWKPILEELTARLTALCDEDEHVRALQREADRICELIVSDDVPEIDIEIQQVKLRETMARWFPDKQMLYQLLYESRFKRLWQQFRQG